MTQPSDALLTSLMYLDRVPLVALRAGAFHAALRAAISASLMCISMTRLLASMVILSPSLTSAMGPPTCVRPRPGPPKQPARPGEAAGQHTHTHTSRRTQQASIAWREHSTYCSIA